MSTNRVVLGLHICSRILFTVYPSKSLTKFCPRCTVATIVMGYIERERGRERIEGISHQSGVKWRKWQLPINRRRRRVTNYTVV